MLLQEHRIGSCFEVLVEPGESRRGKGALFLSVVISSTSIDYEDNTLSSSSVYVDGRTAVRQLCFRLSGLSNAGISPRHNQCSVSFCRVPVEHVLPIKVDCQVISKDSEGWLFIHALDSKFEFRFFLCSLHS